jgi:transketolase
MLRLVISPSPRTIKLPEDYRFSFSKGTVVNDGEDAILFAYGPVMLNEALVASEILKERDFSLRIVNLPWLNRIDGNWLEETIGDCKSVFVLDNHSQYGGLGDSVLNTLMLSNSLRDKRVIKFAIDEHPACGTPQEALSYHKLDSESLVARVLSTMGEKLS